MSKIEIGERLSITDDPQYASKMCHHEHHKPQTSVARVDDQAGMEALDGRVQLFDCVEEILQFAFGEKNHGQERDADGGGNHAVEGCKGTRVEQSEQAKQH